MNVKPLTDIAYKQQTVSFSRLSYKKGEKKSAHCFCVSTKSTVDSLHVIVYSFLSKQDSFQIAMSLELGVFSWCRHCFNGCLPV